MFEKSSRRGLMWLPLMLLWSFFTPQFFLGEINVQAYAKIVATQMSAACVVVLITTATPPNDGAAHPYSLYQP